MAAEAQCRDFNTEVSALLKMEDIMSPLDTMSNKVSIKYQELDASISSSNEILKTDFVIYGSSPAEPKLQEVQMKTSEFFTRLGETTQAIFEEGKSRALQEVAWLKEAITNEMKRLSELNEFFANENQSLEEANAYLSATNDEYGSNNGAIAANNNAIQANNNRIEENNKKIEELEKKLNDCNAHESTVNAASAGYMAKIVGNALSDPRNQSRDAKIRNYAEDLAEAMGNKDEEEVARIMKEMDEELGLDQEGLEQELGRLYREANENGDPFTADEIRPLAHAIQTGEGIPSRDANVSSNIAVPTNFTEFKDAMDHHQDIYMPPGSKFHYDYDNWVGSDLRKTGVYGKGIGSNEIDASKFDGIVLKYNAEDDVYYAYAKNTGEQIYITQNGKPLSETTWVAYDPARVLASNKTSYATGTAGNDTYYDASKVEDFSQPVEVVASTPTSLPEQTTEGPTPLPPQTVEGAIQPEGGSTSGGPAPGGAGSNTTAMLN